MRRSLIFTISCKQFRNFEFIVLFRKLYQHIFVKFVIYSGIWQSLKSICVSIKNGINLTKNQPFLLHLCGFKKWCFFCICRWWYHTLSRIQKKSHILYGYKLKSRLNPNANAKPNPTINHSLLLLCYLGIRDQNPMKKKETHKIQNYDSHLNATENGHTNTRYHTISLIAICFAFN